MFIFDIILPNFLACWNNISCHLWCVILKRILTLPILLYDCRHAQRLNCVMRATTWQTCFLPWHSLRNTVKFTAPNGGVWFRDLAGFKFSFGVTVSTENTKTHSRLSSNMSDIHNPDQNNRHLLWEQILKCLQKQGHTTDVLNGFDRVNLKSAKCIPGHNYIDIIRKKHGTKTTAFKTFLSTCFML